MAVETQAPLAEESTTLLSSAAPEETAHQVYSGDDIPAEDGEGAGGTDEIPGAEGQNSATDETPGLPDELIQAATQYGLDHEAFGNADQLQRAIQNVQAVEDRRLLELEQMWMQQSQQGQYPQGPANGFAPQPGNNQQQQNGHAAAFDLDKLLPADQYDDSVRGAFKALHEHYSPVQQFVQQAAPIMQQMWEKQQQMEQFYQEQSQAKLRQEVDDYFESLGPEWESIFGKGSTSTLPQSSAQYRSRMRLLEQGNLLGSADARMGRAFTPIKDLLGRGLGAAFQKESQSIQRQKLIKQAQGRNGAALAKPGSKAGKPVGNGKAVSLSRDFDRRFNLDDA